MTSEDSAPIPQGQLVDLRAWMAKFSYTQGMQFVRLERISPSEWPPGSRQAIAGQLEDLYEPQDTFDIGQRWGGGVYTVSAVQAGPTNTRTVVDRKRIEIAGPPRCYPGADGRPIAIPQVNGGNASPAAAGNQAADATAGLVGVLNRFSEARADNQALAAVKEIAAQATRQAEQVATAARADAAKLREQMEQRFNSRDQPLKDALEQAQHNFDRMVNSHQAQLDALRSQHETQLAATIRSHEKNLEAREVSLRAELAGLRDQQRSEIAALRDTHRIEAEGIKRDLERERSERDRDTRALQLQLDAARTEATNSGDKRAAEARETLRQMYEPQLTQLRAEVLAARGEAERVRQDAREDMKRREADIRSQYETMSVAKESAIRSSLEAQIHGLQADLRSKEDRLARQDQELAQLREKAMERADPMANLRQAGDLKDLVVSLTGGPQQAGPVGFLQNLASVAAPLRENLIEPVMKRVDQGLAVAESESARRAQAQQMLLQQRGAGQQARAAANQAVQRQIAGGQPPRTHPGRNVRRVARGAPGQRRPQAAQPAQAGTAPAAAAPASASPQVRDGAVQILRQLEAWMQDGTQPSSANSLIRQAVQSGILPADVIANIVNQSTPDLVRDVQSTAGQLGLAALASPRGEDFLTELHKHLRRG